jgi:hypothetical protein
VLGSSGVLQRQQAFSGRRLQAGISFDLSRAPAQPTNRCRIALKTTPPSTTSRISEITTPQSQPSCTAQLS